MKPRKPQRRPGRKGNTVPTRDDIPQAPAQASLIDKLRGKGPTTFTGEELGRLHGAFEDITQEILQLRRLNSGFAEGALPETAPVDSHGQSGWVSLVRLATRAA